MINKLFVDLSKKYKKMDNWNLRTFRNDLSIFIELIKSNGVTGDFSGLDTLNSNLENKDLIEYALENVSFHINGRIIGTQPDDLNYCEVLLETKLKVSDDLQEVNDPLYRYSLDLNITAFQSKIIRNKVCTSSWHLDKHNILGNEKYSHPTYHFQYGGKKLELIDDDMVVLSCPRIPHPPMDVFLAFHFVLLNYYNKRQYLFVDLLLGDYDYQQIIKRAQERLWTPYFNGFDSDNSHHDFTINKMFPLYIN